MLKRIRDLLGGRGRKSEKSGPQPSAAAEPVVVRRGPDVVHRPIAEVDLDPDAVRIVQRLNRFDHTAYFVGGCVRDLLLERKPKDFDLGTSATPRQVKRLFRNCRIIGRRFRLAHVYFQNGKIIEVATFRAPDSPEDVDADDPLIRDDNVFGSEEEDALRRDFTINSLFYDMSNETVLDHADGLGDLRRRLVRCIGDPELRFREDPIRCLRAIKFAARLDFEIEKGTLRALRDTAGEISKAAPPRVLEEINRMCRGGAGRRSFELMRETGTLEVILPELDGASGDDWDWTLELLARMDAERFGDRREIRTGEIVAVLLLPALAREFGWGKRDQADGQRRLDLRDLVDQRLRPMSVRLRVPRREQEYCRQILSSLYRMVPAERVRRQAKRAILRRECFPDAMWILEASAARFGGEIEAAVAAWKQAAADAGVPAAPGSQDRAESRDDGRDGREGRGGRRRRRRGGRGRGRGRGGGGADSPRPAATQPAARERKRDLPPVWDDDYFFAALPEAPDTPREEDDDRGSYGGTAVAVGAGSDAHDDAEAADGESGEAASAQDAGSASRPEGGGRRRRRRRGRRRRKPAGDEAAAANTDAVGEDEPSGDGDEE